MGVYALTTVPVVFSEHRIPLAVRKKKKNGGWITFASHMSLKSVLGVSSRAKRADKEESLLFFSSLSLGRLCKHPQAPTGRAGARPCS